MKINELRNSFYKLKNDEQRLVKKMRIALERGYHDPSFFTEYFLGIPLHEGQCDYIRQSDPIYNLSSNRKNILVPCNRWGKTVILACKHIRFNFYKLLHPKMSLNSVSEMRYRTLDLSPHSNQVRACFNYIFDILHNRFVIVDSNGKRRNNHCRMKGFFQSKNESQLKIEFANNSSFHGASTGEDQASSLAGAQFGYISYDECVFSLHLRDELPARIMSRTVDFNAPIDLVSTFDTEAKSQQFYYGLVKKGLEGRNEWYVKTGKYTDNTFIPKDIIDKSREKIKAEDYNKYRQVFLGEAIPSSVKMFEPEIINQMFKDESIRKEEPRFGKSYLISVDWGGSEQGDPTVMFVIDYTDMPYKIIHHEKILGGSPHVNFSLLKTLQISYNNAKIIMDTNSLGGVIIKKILNDMKVNTYDFDAHGGEKGEALTDLRLALTYNRKTKFNDKGEKVDLNPNFGKLRSYYIAELEDQLGMYQVDDKKIEQDFVAALYQAMWWLEKKYRQPPKQTYYLKRNLGERQQMYAGNRAKNN